MRVPPILTWTKTSIVKPALDTLELTITISALIYPKGN